jgi:hypothetical protein
MINHLILYEQALLELAALHSFLLHVMDAYKTSIRPVLATWAGTTPILTNSTTNKIKFKFR